MRVSFVFGMVPALLVALAWGGRYALAAATLGLAAQSCWWNWPNNGWANLYVVVVYSLWLGWHGWAARRRAGGRGGWWLDPYLVQLQWTLVFALGMLTVFDWSFRFNPAPWAPSAGTAMPAGILHLILLKTSINHFLLVLAADVLLQVGPVRRAFGLPAQPGGRYDSLVVGGAITVAALIWLLDATVVWLLGSGGGAGWWQEFSHPEADRMVSRLLLVVLCLAGGVLFTRLMRRRVRMAEELRVREEDLRITLDSIGDAVIATDAGGRVMRLNRVAERLTGWPPAEAVGRPLGEVFRIVNAVTRIPCQDPVALVLASGQVVGLANHTVLLARGGREYQIADSGAPIRAAAGTIVGVVLVFRDVTEEHALQEQLAQARKLDALGQLAGGVAHDFNNMLAGIIGATDLLHRQGADAQRRERLLGMISSAANRAAELTRKLLAFGRKGTGLHTPVPVHEAVASAASLLQHSIDKRVVVRQELGAVCDLVAGDLAELQSVFLNLGINAAHAMPEGGELVFSSREAQPDAIAQEAFALAAGPYLELQVRDSGCGIPAEILPRIFDPFFTTKAPGHGTGLGLAAAYGTIRHHRGAITVVSTPGAGTCFTIHLPLIATPSAPVAAAAVAGSSAGQGRVLVVDDEPLVRETALLLLADLGYQAEGVGDGEAALVRYAPGRFDLVLLDVVMPRMDGRTCCRRLLAADPRALVVLCSGYSQDEDPAVLRALGVAGVLCKPYQAAELAGLLARLLAGR